MSIKNNGERKAWPVVKADRMLSIAALKECPHQIWDMLPLQSNPLTQADAEYHFQQRQNWLELNQMEASRNLTAHAQVYDLAGSAIQPGAVLLEIGGGVGFDAQHILARAYPIGCYLFSEISIPLLQYVAQDGIKTQRIPLIFCALDASEMMIESGQVDVILMIAALHHIPALWDALSEMDRTAKPGAHIIFGIEPNRFWSRWLIRLRNVFRPLFPNKSHSAADEESEGFSMADFQTIAGRTGWQLRTLRPVWLTCGFLHYGLEFLYRALRLKKRLRLPAALEYVFITLDEWLFQITPLWALAWHYTVSYQKTEAS